MGAMQAQDYRAALWAIGLRVSGSVNTAQADVEQVIADGKIVRTWPMRGTLHFVAAKDVRWMLRLLTPRILKSSAGRYRQLELDDAVFSKSRNVIEKTLLDHQQLTRAEIYEELNRSGISTEGQRGYHILHNLAQKGVICFGPQHDKQQTFVLLDEWVSPGEDFRGDDALAELSRRYFTSHGPATDRDFAWWSGLTLTNARKGIEMVEFDLQREVIDDTAYWYSSNLALAEPSTPSVFLLPAFDEYLLGYTDRSAVLDSSLAVKEYARNGIFRPSIVIDGCVKGTWSRKLLKTHATVQIQLFKVPDSVQSKSIRKAAEKYSAFVGKEIEIEGLKSSE